MVCLNMGLAAVAAMSLLAHTSAAAPQLVAGPDVSAANETEVFAGNATDGGNKTECTKRLGMHCPWRAEIKTIRVLPDDEWIAVERREEVLEPQPATTASTETAAAATPPIIK
ncbi:hypothetical protein HIM_09341 [Hirsutella minnesotensis 3608]|uniref:Uncharacterized protein n=1 Tax=Hirsutella minnesotensis 3608 TaxID=1043627 RepID=A0A0F7ZSF4_9HYPO|nr:hypothetical protein HIM_09341 [Hirsutella minnesotensis 3608]